MPLLGSDFAAFDWDDANAEKCRKHGVDTATVEQVLGGEPALFEDREHSGEEARYKAIGRTPEGRYVFIAFTLRERDGDILARPISARYMHRREIERYEQTTSAHLPQ